MNDQLYTIAQQRHADLQRTAEHERLARAIRNPRRRTGNQRPITHLTNRPPHWARIGRLTPPSPRHTPTGSDKRSKPHGHTPAGHHQGAHHVHTANHPAPAQNASGCRLRRARRPRRDRIVGPDPRPNRRAPPPEPQPGDHRRGAAIPDCPSPRRSARPHTPPQPGRRALPDRARCGPPRHQAVEAGRRSTRGTRSCLSTIHRTHVSCRWPRTRQSSSSPSPSPIPIATSCHGTAGPIAPWFPTPTSREGHADRNGVPKTTNHRNHRARTRPRRRLSDLRAPLPCAQICHTILGYPNTIISPADHPSRTPSNECRPLTPTDYPL